MTRDLPHYIAMIQEHKNIERIVITTNGTVMPHRELLNVIKQDDRMIICVSDYRIQLGKSGNNTYQKRTAAVIKMFEEVATVVLGRQLWMQTSPIRKNKRSIAELKEYYSECQKLHAPYFVALWGGKIYTCPRSGIYQVLGYPLPENEFVDLQADKTPEQLREELISFFSRDYYTGCNFCNNVEDAKKPLVKPGEQISNSNEFGLSSIE